jgi:CTD kinase subunit alpha
MVFEYMFHDLTGILMNPNLKLEPVHIKSLVRQMFIGLDYLHSRHILHRDIKGTYGVKNKVQFMLELRCIGSNLLLTNEGILKLADFGLAKPFIQKKCFDFTNRVITLWYRPPELLLGCTKYGPAVDMWSAG